MSNKFLYKKTDRLKITKQSQLKRHGLLDVGIHCCGDGFLPFVDLGQAEEAECQSLTGDAAKPRKNVEYIRQWYRLGVGVINEDHANLNR